MGFSTTRRIRVEELLNHFRSELAEAVNAEDRAYYAEIIDRHEAELTDLVAQEAADREAERQERERIQTQLDASIPQVFVKPEVFVTVAPDQVKAFGSHEELLTGNPHVAAMVRQLQDERAAEAAKVQAMQSKADQERAEKAEQERLRRLYPKVFK